MASTETHTASCACGAVTAVARGAPVITAMCSCTQCQRRTGSAFGLSVYFEEADVTLSVETRTYSRRSQRDRRFTQHFCPTCGTSLYWRGEFQPGRVGIAGGCFHDPSFIQPEVAVWDRNRHPWLAQLLNLPTHAEQRT